MKNKWKIVAAAVAALGVGLAPACSFKVKSNPSANSGDVTEKNWTVRFESNGGTTVSDLVVKNGNTAVKPVDPTREGFTFLGWYTDQSFTTEYNFNGLVEKSFTLYAKWQENERTEEKVTVTFSNDGTTSVEIDKGSKITKPADPVKTGYRFIGWFNGENQFDFNSNVESNITLTARFEINTYTVTFDTAGGSTIAAQTISYNQKATMPTAPTKAGYVFEGWYLNNAKYSFDTAVTSNITLVAKYEISKCVVTFDTQGGSAINPLNLDYNSTATKPEDPVKEGYTFKGWFNGNDEYNFQSKVTGSITLTAKWEINTYTVSFDVEGIASQEVNYNTVATKPVDPAKTGYTFKGWYLGDTEYSFTQKVTSNITLVAKFEINKYIVAFNYTGIESQEIEYNNVALKPTNPIKDGYTFLGWYINDTEFDFNTKITDNITLAAKFKANEYTVSFNTNGGSSIASIKADYDTTITKPTNPTKEGYTFSKWTLNGVEYDFTAKITGNITLAAEWNINTYLVTFITDGTSVDNQTVEYNKLATAPSTTKTGYVFVGWYLGDDLFDFNTQITAPITLTAKFDKEAYVVSFDVDGGSSVVSQEVKYQEKATAPATNPVKNQYRFDGWYKDQALTQTFDFDIEIITSDTTVYAKWIEDSTQVVVLHTITYVYDNGQENKVDNIQDGQKATAPIEPTKEGYDFDGWYIEAVEYDFNNNVTGDITLTAKWTIKTYTVSFNVEGIEPQTINHGSNASQPVTPTKTGYKFGGWYKDSTCENAYDFTASVESSFTLYAKWNIESYTIIIDTANGAESTTVTIEYGTKLTEPAKPTKEGYTFVGWYKDSIEYNFNQAVESAFTLTAKWNVNKYTITFNSNGGSSVASITEDYGTALSAPLAPSKAGYDFEGWYTDVALTKPYTFTTMTENVELYAKWTELFYTITYVTEYSSATALNDVNRLPEVFPQLTYSGYIFKGWYMESTYINPAEAGKRIYEDTNLYARWDVDNTAQISTNMIAYIDDLIDKTTNSSTPYKPSWISEGFKDKWNYIDGVFLSSIVDLYRQTGNEKYKNFLVSFVNYYIDENGNFLKASTGATVSLGNALDDICESRILFDLYQFTQDQRYLKAIENTYTKLMSLNKASGSPCYEHKDTYANQIWLDGFYMYVPFYARYALYNNDSSIFDTIKSQYEYAYTHMVDESTGLLYHGYDTTKTIFWSTENNGRSKSFWLRSMGWYIASLVDVLDYFPEGTNKEYLKNQLQDIMDSLMVYQDSESKMFYQVIDKGPITDSNGKTNYLESSGSSIIAYVAMKGARKGYLSSDYLTKGSDIYEGIYTHSFDSETNKLNHICSQAGLGPASNTKRDGTLEYYLSESIVSNDAKGTGPFIMAYLQYGSLELPVKTITYVDDYLIYQQLVADNNSVISEPVIKDRAGYTFDGWYTTSACTTKFDFTQRLTANTTIYAKWSEKITYSVTYNINGHGTQPENVTGVNELPATLPTLTATGYTFDGWYTNSSLTTKAVAGAEITANTTLYAKWTEVIAEDTNVYKVNASEESAMSNTMGTNSMFSYNGSITIDSSKYFKFASSIATDETTVYKNFIAITVNGPVTIKVKGKYSSSDASKYCSLRILGDGIDSQTSNFTTSEAEYTVNINFTGEKTLYMGRSGNTSMYVNYIEVTSTESGGSETTKYNIVYNINGHGTQPDDVENVTALPATLPTLTATGYTFGGWYTNSSLTTKAVAGATISANTTLYAKWTKDSESEGTKSITMNGTSYSTIASALAAVPTSSKSSYNIVLGKGTYNENGLSYNGSATIKISGNTTTQYGADVIIKGHGSNMTAMRTRELLEVRGSGNIILENLTLESDWSRADHSGDVQAEVLGTDTTGYTAAYNCSFLSHQDTLRTAGKAWFYGCYIEGDVDFLWMEQSGKVALYEECEIVSVYDTNTSNHATYITAPRMATSTNVSKGLVIYNSTVREQNSSQKTYLARTPWTSGYYNQVAYINTTCSGIESAVWYGSQISTSYPKTVIGWKMDQATASSIGYAGNNDILDAQTVAKEYSGRRAIMNRVYNTSEGAYEKDASFYWDIDAFIASVGWSVSTDTSAEVVAGDTVKTVTTYMFDRSASSSGVYSLDSNVQGNTLTWQGLTIDATASDAKFAYNGSNSYQFNPGTKISFSVPANSTVEVISYPGQHNFTVNGTAATADSTLVNMTSAGTINIVSTAQSYLISIVVTTVEDNTPQTFTISFNTMGGNTISPVDVVEGSKLTAPTAPTRAGYEFAGWYTNSGCTTAYNFNNTVTNSFTLYAKWNQVNTDTELALTAYAGYTEGMYATFPETDATSAVVEYSTDGISFKRVDSPLVRQQDDTTARVDVVGLTSGVYSLRVTASNNKTKTVNGIYVNEDDRSGYAHFGNTTGIGAYNNDGTLKSNATVVYLTEDNKNNLTATVAGKSVTGSIVNIINAATSSSHSLDIRVLGRVSSAQWNKITYPSDPYTKWGGLPKAAADGSNSYDSSQIVIKGKVSGYDSIVATGANSMSNDLANGITRINGLTNEVRDGLDSYFNMCDVKETHNITVEGIGPDAEIFQWGFEFIKCNSIEIKNLKFSNYTEDAAGFEGSSSKINDYGNYWVHNCEFNPGVNNWDVCDDQDKADGDGSTDFKYCHNVTISYTKYNHTHKTNLIGANKDSKQYNFTLHHNYYNEASQRLPLVRQSNIHMYNNYYYGLSKEAYSGISIRSHAYAFIENNTFNFRQNPIELRVDKDQTGPGVFKSIGNEFLNTPTLTTGTSQTGYATNNASSRSQQFTSTCNGGAYANFDTNSSLFYYKNGQSDVMLLESAAESKETVIKYAGVLKSDNVGGPIVSGTTYEVSFVTNNGTTVPTQTVKEGRSVNLPTDLTKVGYKLEGWYTNSSLTNKYTGSGITANTTLYAKWVEPQTFTVTFNTNGGNTIASKNVVEGNLVEMPSNPTKDGNMFKGWYTDSSLTQAFNPSAPITANTTLYAKWKEASGGELLIPTCGVSSGETIISNDVISVKSVSMAFTLSASGAGTVNANDDSEYTFESGLLAGGTCTSKGIEITALESGTITIYYTISDGNFLTSSSINKTGALSINGTAVAADSAHSNAVAYAYTLDVVAGNTYTVFVTSQRLILFGIETK